nr:uncharacterized protein LOC129437435 [Misgurnus anguillicaudatus]
MSLVLLCREKDFKEFGHAKVFSEFLGDLKELEENGIVTSHKTGDDPNLCGPERTIEKYDSAIERLQTEDTSEGVKFRSVFNSLNYFHVCQPGLPPCLGHDIFEGILSYDVALCLKYFVKTKKWFTYSTLNRRINQFKYCASDASTKPCTVKPLAKKLSGQAIQNWNFLRLLPLLIGDLVKDTADDVWQLILQLKDIVDMAYLSAGSLGQVVLQVKDSSPFYLELYSQAIQDAVRQFGFTDIDTQEADLASVLRPIQARRLVAAWKQTIQSPETHSQSAVSPSVSPLTSSNSTHSSLSPCTSTSNLIRTADWVDSFQIPWGTFPEDLMQCLERGKRPSPRLRREMIRIVVSAMMNTCASPSKLESTEVAKKIVAKYPQSLKDVIEGEVVGAGYHSLVKQLQARIDNVKRPSASRIKRRKPETGDSDTDEIPAEQRAVVQDTYGCIKWNLKFMPVSETLESQQEKKDKMKMLREQHTFSPEEVKALMKCTYYSQRQAINTGTDLQHLIEEWPFLFEEIGMTVHFLELTGLPLKDTFLNSVEKKGKRLLNFMTTVCADKTKRVLETAIKLKFLRGPLEGSSGDIKDMVLLILSYFNEKEEHLFHYVEETCLANEVQVEGLPVTPCIIVCGTCCYGARQFMLSIDGKIVNDQISNFTTAICLMFGSYYCLNIHYPVDLGSTLEFLQRCFFNINPERGTKVETKKNKKQLTVNPRVLTLIADLADHEWRQTN